MPKWSRKKSALNQLKDKPLLTAVVKIRIRTCVSAARSILVKLEMDLFLKEFFESEGRCFLQILWGSQ